ncbi:immunoglobulin superfamily member 10-like [Oculina patagonica]
MMGVVWCFPCAFWVIVVINSKLVATQVEFTSRYNGNAVIGYLHSAVNFSWTHTGELRLVEWGTKRSDSLDLDQKLVSFDINGQLLIPPNLPPQYSGSVNGSWDRSTGQLTFTLASIKEEDDNTIFLCKLSPKDLLIDDLFDTVQLIVRDPPKAQLVKPVSKVVEARVGSSTSFTCNASGLPLPSIRWMKQSGSSVNEIVANNVKYQVDSSPGSSQLIIKNISDDDDKGYYICNASSFESHSERVFLGVISLIRSTESCPSTNQNALRGVPTTICCPVRGFPPPDVTWTLPDGTVQKTGNTILPITPKANDFGNYTCSAEGLKETDSDPVLVSINLQEEGLKMSIAAKNNTQLREGVKFEWSEVKGAKNYICRVHGADIDSTSLLGDKNSLEIPHSKLDLKDPNNKADSVKVYIEVLAIDESEVIGRGGPFAAEIFSVATTPGLSFIVCIVLFVSVLNLQ